MNPSKEQDSKIDNYLGRLRESLPNISVAEREEIVREISVHIRESAEESDDGVDAILKRLGPAESLASQYGHESLIRHASRSFSPMLILRATLALASRGLQGFALFFGALVGYTLGVGLVVTALLKPIFPHKIGLWVGPGTFDFGFHQATHPDSVHELLGGWFIPVALLLGCFFVMITTQGIRWYLRQSRGRGPLFSRRGIVQPLALV